jgi:predicted AAA+ superfamily ATPase
MREYQRHLLLNLPPRQSAFLWGARKTGKSTLVRERFPESLVFDLLDTDLFFEFSKEPSRLRQKLAAADAASLHKHIVIDEFQKVPSLLDEIHWLIENKNLSFLLCGSSARKLKRGHANLLGGRAWRCELFSPVLRRDWFVGPASAGESWAHPAPLSPKWFRFGKIVESVCPGLAKRKSFR